MQAVMILFAMAVVADADQPVADKKIPLHEAELDLDRLRGWETRVFVYRLTRGGESAVLGTVTMRTEVASAGVTLTDNWRLRYHGQDLRLELKMDCRRDNLLRPKTIQSVGEGDEEFGTFTVKVGADQATVTGEDGGSEDIEFPANTLTDIGLFRAFTLLPRNPGSTFTVAHVMEVSEMHLKGPAVLAYRGPDEITLHGKPVTLDKFVYIRDGRTAAEAWVDSDHILRQVRLDGRKTLTEKRE
jgi:hypothetical protein